MSTVFQVAATGAAGGVVGGRTLPLRRADNSSDVNDGGRRRPTDPQKRLRCLPPPPPPPRGFYWLQHQHQQQQLTQNVDHHHPHHPSSSSTSPGADSDRPSASYLSATLPAPDSRTASRDHRGGGHLGRAVTSSAGHSSADDVADSTPQVYQISPGATSMSSPLRPTHEVVV